MRRNAFVAGVAALAAGAVTLTAFAQGSGSEPLTEGAALVRLPKDITGFERWTRMNFKPLPSRGGGAHPGVKRVYVNRSRTVLAPGGKQRFPYPNGTIIVKTATNGGVITLVAIGRKKKGLDRARGDWEFIEYKRSSGSRAFDEIVRGEVCYSCHVGAKKTDWIFTPVR